MKFGESHKYMSFRKYKVMQEENVPVDEEVTRAKLHEGFINSTIMRILHEIHGFVTPYSPETILEEERRAKVYADFSSQEYECLKDALGLITVNKHLNLDKAMKMLQWFKQSTCPCTQHVISRGGNQWQLRPIITVPPEVVLKLPTVSNSIMLKKRAAKKTVTDQASLADETSSMQSDGTSFEAEAANKTSLARKTKGKCSPEIIIGMDHNIDLLKGSCHNPTQQFITDLSNIDLLPTIMRPTRIMNHSATLIDNIYVSIQLYRDFESTIIINNLSDHFQVLTMLKQTKLLNKEPLTFTSRCLNDQKLKEVNHRLMRKDWIGLLTGTICDEKFNQFSMTLNTTLDEVAPTRTVRISGKRRYVEPWMTRGLEEASRTKLKLYKKYLQRNSSDDDYLKYKRYRNTYNELKRKLKVEYYQAKCESYKSNSKKLWTLINSTITKIKHKGSIIPYITVDGIKKTRPMDIANSFGDFYARLGSNLANNISSSTTSIEEYISRIPRQLNSIVLHPTTVHEIDKIIRDLPNKSSHGHDEISNITLKALRTSIIFPLCHIFNQSLVEGTFPEKMKWAEIIPLYKGKSMDLTINYRPISLLITTSKVLEKLIYK